MIARYIKRHACLCLFNLYVNNVLEFQVVLRQSKGSKFSFESFSSSMREAKILVPSQLGDLVSTITSCAGLFSLFGYITLAMIGLLCGWLSSVRLTHSAVG